MSYFRLLLKRYKNSPPWARVTTVTLIAFYLLLVFVNSWMSDDIYITFRTLYNFTEGYGLRWNITERVQTFTHPLWMMVLLPGYWLTKHAYLTALFNGLLFSTLAVVSLFLQAKTYRHGILAVLLLICSRAYVDFSTSGLENPLTFFLLVLFAIHGIQMEEKKGNVFNLSFLGSLLLLNRLDHLLIVGPVLLWAFLKQTNFVTLRRILIGMTPLILWELFALVYYGFLLPNTFYAKAQTGFAAAKMIEQGFYYLQDSLIQDYISLPLILISLFAGMWSKSGFWKIWTCSILLYLCYIVWVGGDFMSGRFITTPFLMGVLIISHVNWQPRFLLGIGIIVVGLALLHPYHPIYTRSDYYQDRKGNERTLFSKGIVDEKGMAWERSGLLDLSRWDPVLKVEQDRKNWGPDPGKVVHWEIQRAVGMRGYQGGPNLFILDQLALTDPLLARLPAEHRTNWRVGHYFRKIPEGYLESLKTGEDRLVDRSLAMYYLKLKKITEAPLFEQGRFKEILRFNTGYYDHLIDKEYYQKFD